MAERLVTAEDLEKHPELVSQGVSVNMYYDFDALESTNTPDGEPTPQITEPPKEKTKLKKAKTATRPTKKAAPTKQKAKRK